MAVRCKGRRRTARTDVRLPIIRSRTVKRFSFGAKPAEGTHSIDAGLRCGRLRPADVCDVEPFGTQLAKRTHSHELRAFAGRSCGPPMACAIEFCYLAAGYRTIRASFRAYYRWLPQEKSDATLPSAAQCGERHTPFKRRSASGWDNAVHRLLCLFVRPKT